jgi:hypothetical protein
MASARRMKLSKKTVSRTAAAATTTHVAIRTSNSKGVAGASGSKNAASAKKAASPIQKGRIPAVGIMAEASLAESHESSPHGQMPRDLVPKMTSRPELPGQTP